MAPLLTVKGVGKAFGATQALKAVSLEVKAGEVHCLLGENGAGKSTLCNLIFGVIQPDQGEFHIEGRPLLCKKPAEAIVAGVGMVHQHFSLVPTMTVLENLMLGRGVLRLPRSEALSRLEELKSSYGLEVEPQKLVSTMSIGERQRVEIIKCLFNDPKLLLLDEPTAVLPPGEIDAMLGICRDIASRGHGVVLVTHKLAEIAQVADRTTVLRAGQVVETVNMSTASIPALIGSMIGQDATLSDAAFSIVSGHSLNDPEIASTTPGSTKTKAQHGRTKLPAFVIQNVSVRDETGAMRLSNVNLTVARGEVVGIAGVEGNGQRQLGDVVAGMVVPATGSMMISGIDVTGKSPREITAAGAGIVPEDRHAVGCILEMSVAENLFLGSMDRFSHFGLLNRRALRTKAAELLTQYEVVGRPDDLMANLSGGNQQKVVLARELSLQNLVFLLAAMPTRGLDVKAANAVYARIREARERGVGVLLISNELDELMALSDRILVMYRGSIIGEMEATATNREAIGALMSGHTDLDAGHAWAFSDHPPETSTASVHSSA